MKNITWDGRDVDGQAMAWGTHESLGRVRFLSLHFAFPQPQFELNRNLRLFSAGEQRLAIHSSAFAASQ